MRLSFNKFFTIFVSLILICEWHIFYIFNIYADEKLF